MMDIFTHNKLKQRLSYDNEHKRYTLSLQIDG